jgi:gliding motility-associated-like protein
MGGTFTMCPEDQSFWATLTPPNSSAGGKWYDADNVQVQGSLNTETLSGILTYQVGEDFCQETATYQISLVPSPTFETSSGRPYCETQCDGFISSTTSPGFQLYASDGNGPFNDQLSDLCAGSYTVTTTNGTGCSRLKDFNLTFEYVNLLSGMPNVICTSELTRFSDYMDLSRDASLILNDMSIATHTALDLINNQMYTLTIYDYENCIDRSVEFRTELCPTSNTDVIFIPNAFTPNEDGVNDLFKVVSQYELEFYEMQIFDRYGARVFASTNPDEGWNGSHGGGSYYLPPGICNYHVRYKLPNDLETKTMFGTIQILR